MFKQCCGCKGKPDKDETDDEKEKPGEAVVEKNSVSPKVDNKEINTSKPAVVVTASEPVPPVVAVEEEKKVQQKEEEHSPRKEVEEVTKESKNPGLTIDTNPDLENIEDDDDNLIVPITPRTAKGLTPHPAKRNSTPGLSAIPKWLSQDDEEEAGGTAEPPVTPVGRDELALRRHRFFSDLLVAAQAATEHRVRFDPLGPSVAGMHIHPESK